MDMLTDDFQGCPLPGGFHKFYFQSKVSAYEPVLPTDAMYISELLYKFVEYGMYSCNCMKVYKVRINGKGL